QGDVPVIDGYISNEFGIIRKSHVGFRRVGSISAPGNVAGERSAVLDLKVGSKTEVDIGSNFAAINADLRTAVAMETGLNIAGGNGTAIDNEVAIPDINVAGNVNGT